LLFKIFDAPAGGTLLWSETQSVNTGSPFAGVFTANLGLLNPLPASLFRDHPSLYLGMTIETDPELGRWPLGSTPFAASSSFVKGATLSSLSCGEPFAL
jgi:hypothetical protein